MIELTVAEAVMVNVQTKLVHTNGSQTLRVEPFEALIPVSFWFNPVHPCNPKSPPVHMGLGKAGKEALRRLMLTCRGSESASYFLA